MAGAVASAWREFLQDIKRELSEAEQRRDRYWQRSDQVAAGCQEAAAKLADDLWRERTAAEEVLQQCEVIVREFTARLGRHELDDERCLLLDSRAALGVLSDHLGPAKQRLAELLADNRGSLHQLAMLELRQRHRTTKSLATLEQLDAMDQHEFDEIVFRGLSRGGFQPLLLEPRILTFVGAGARGLVYCANVQRPRHDAVTDARAILSAQREARSRDIGHVLIVTNLMFISSIGNQIFDASDLSMTLLQRPDLQRWIDWGMPLRDVVADA